MTEDIKEKFLVSPMKLIFSHKVFVGLALLINGVFPFLDLVQFMRGQAWYLPFIIGHILVFGMALVAWRLIRQGELGERELTDMHLAILPFSWALIEIVTEVFCSFFFKNTFPLQSKIALHLFVMGSPMLAFSRLWLTQVFITFIAVGFMVVASVQVYTPMLYLVFGFAYIFSLSFSNYLWKSRARLEYDLSEWERLHRELERKKVFVAMVEERCRLGASLGDAINSPLLIFENALQSFQKHVDSSDVAAISLLKIVENEWENLQNLSRSLAEIREIQEEEKVIIGMDFETTALISQIPRSAV